MHNRTMFGKRTTHIGHKMFKQNLIRTINNHRGLDARWHEVTTDDSENSLCKLTCVEKKLFESMSFLLGLVQKIMNNLILHRSKFEE